MAESKFQGVLNQASQVTLEHRRGRPRGKRSDPDYTQVTVYLPKTLHRGVRSKLALQGREFSQLVEELLTDWEKTEEG